MSLLSFKSLRQAAASALALAAIAGAAYAEEYPQKPINFVVSVGAGGAVDNLARIIGQQLELRLKQPVIVQSKPGATGSLAARAVAASPADGYTAMFTSTMYLQAPHIIKNAGYSLDDFVGVSSVAAPSVVMVVNANSPYKTLAELLDAARSSGKPVRYGAVGVGSSPHIYGETLRVDSKVPMVAVAYKGEPQEVVDLVGGSLDAGILSLTAVQQMIEGGKLRPLAVVGNGRLSLMPDVPTFSELGYPRVNLIGWFGLLLPAKTPKDRVEKLSAAVQAIVRDPSISAQLVQAGFHPVGNTSAEFTAQLRRDFDQWRQLMREAAIQPE